METGPCNPGAGAPNVSPAAIVAAREMIAAAERVLVLTHINPDGDAIGSALGLGLILRAGGKQVVVACPDAVPDTFDFLPHVAEVTAVPEGDFDLTVAVDVSDASRLGALAGRVGGKPHLLFDHHTTNPGFADVNLLDAAAASTAELIVELVEPLGLTLTREAAECLLTGIVNDTLGFRTSNTTVKTLAQAQWLMQLGAPLGTICDRSLYARSISALRLWAVGLTRIQLRDRIVWATLPLEARRTAGYFGDGDADLVSVLSTVREADVAVVFNERPDGKVKVSWRARPLLNVARLAVIFGGGGHAPAAGAEIPGSLIEVETTVIAATREALAQATGPTPLD